MTSAYDRATAACTPEELLDEFPGTPTRLRDIATALGVRTIARPPKLPVGGLLRQLPDGGFEIHIRSADSVPRQRFTLAHELAHILIGKASKDPVGTLGCGDRRIERDCDNLAVRLLLPLKAYPEVMLSDHPMSAAREAANLYLASRQAAALRLRDLRPECSIVAWATRARPGAPSKLRVIWAASPEGTYIPIHAPWPKSATEPAAVDNIIAEDVKVDLGSIRGTVHIESWRLDNAQGFATGPEILSALHAPRPR